MPKYDRAQIVDRMSAIIDAYWQEYREPIKLNALNRQYAVIVSRDLNQRFAEFVMGIPTLKILMNRKGVRHVIPLSAFESLDELGKASLNRFLGWGPQPTAKPKMQIVPKFKPTV